MATATDTRPQTGEQPKTEPPRLWHVVLLDDDDHTYEYVIRMVQELFGYSRERAFQIACEVDTRGRAICLTTHREHAELKRDQIHAYGPDRLIATCRGSMTAVLEPADVGDGGAGHSPPGPRP